jgi:capsular exopolysaccharide synthesis family protein
LSAGKKIQIISITSSVPKEGKTFITVNLAAVTAQSKKKTLLIDCDMRHPSVQKLLGLDAKEGLSTILTKGESDLKAVPFYDSEIENFTILPAGPIPPNPAELLESDTMNKLLANVRNEYDFIYIDNPPLLSVTDPLIMAKKSDGVILVAAACVSAKSAVLRSYNILKDTDINTIGTILNMSDVGMRGYGKYGYGHYGYYYGK